MTDQVSGGMDASLLKGAVVVGDDGSADSADAVLWAAEDAARRETRLVVVRAWSITTAPRPEGVETGYIPSEDEFAEAVRKALATDVEPVLRRSAVKPEVVLMPAHCSAETALIDATAHAAVTVVGTRGRGLARWLGSVSTALVRSAHGPVVVVPRSSRGESG
ncbi:MAG TPA: universal stress protein [Actinomycetes bacterium]|nr:universal stress protein [Actinomycetes bacterium]